MQRLDHRGSARIPFRTLALAMALTITIPTFAWYPRDIEFVCPCSAVWNPDPSGQGGKLTLSFGLRSYRITDSGSVTLLVRGIHNDTGQWHQAEEPFEVSPLPAKARTSRLSLTRNLLYSSPSPESILLIHISERLSADESDFFQHERLTLWPVPDHNDSGRIEFIDILTDSDDDGVGDVNERLAGTLPNDDTSTPGETTIDLLALYTAIGRDGYNAAWYARESFYTRMHHVLTVANSMFEDSGANLRLRTVGFAEVDVDEYGRALNDQVERQMTRHGADLTYQFTHNNERNPCGAQGCAVVGGVFRGFWRYGYAIGGINGGAHTVAHELGHVMGLAHSARQGEAHGTFRWSRGHYFAESNDANASYAQWADSNYVWYDRSGTIMSYSKDRGTMFSDPDADCDGQPCGMDPDHFDGADSVATLDLMRFRVAAHHESKRDSDNDGVVDDADVAPSDPTDWNDNDGDGIGDNADPDDDNDGVDDDEDRFAYDPNEWEDLDGDGIGDNADQDVEALTPFQDAALRTLVERTLGKPPGALITDEELASLVELSGRSLGIRNLAGLEAATRLRILKLPFNHITELSPLSGLMDLEELDLFCSRVSDVSPLRQHTNLRRLNLGCNGVVDLSPLSGLASLENLRLDNNNVADLTPLEGLPKLTYLLLGRNDVSDVSPLSKLTSLEVIGLEDNDISEISPLSEMTNLSRLSLQDNNISDISSLSEMSGLTDLNLSRNSISDISPLSGLSILKDLRLANVGAIELSHLAGLTSLTALDLDGNEISDLYPLSRLTNLQILNLNDNSVSDLSPLDLLTQLKTLNLNANSVSDLSPLSRFAELTTLGVGANYVTLADVLALPQLDRFERLGLAHLGISDISPLSRLRGIRSLNLRGNDISNIQPLVNRLVWSHGSGTLFLEGNPLDDVLIREQKSKIEAFGVQVRYDETDDSPEVDIPDPNLRALVAQLRAYANVHVDDPMTEASLRNFRVLMAFNAGVSDLTGLEAATNLRNVWLGSNSVTDLTPLSNLTGLEVLDLSDNQVSDLSPLIGVRNLQRLVLTGNHVSDLSPLTGASNLQRLVLTGNLVSDISPLVENADFADGDRLVLTDNPLSEESLNTHIPALLERGVRISLESISLAIPSGRETSFDMATYFTRYGGTLLWSDVVITAETDDPEVISAEIESGVLTLSAGTSEGKVAVTLTAEGTVTTETNTYRPTKTLKVDVTVAHIETVGLYAAVSDRSRQGFLRVVNRSTDPGAVYVEAIDDAGVTAGPVTLAMNPRSSAQFSSDDLENGNRTKRLSGATGTGDGDWRLKLITGLDIEVLSYIETTDGFLTSMHDTAPETDAGHHVATFNPASNIDQVSRLRLINPGYEAATVTIHGVDDDGESPSTSVEVSVPPRAVRTLSATELEEGEDVAGSLGDGSGAWSLTVSSAQTIRVMNLLESADGLLANLSTIPIAEDGVHSLPLFPSAADSGGLQGVVRVINNADTDAVVNISAFDETDRVYEAITLTVGANKVVHLNSDDLELGNEDKGLDGSTGAGSGDWRLELTSESAINVLSYIKSSDGFLVPMHDVVPRINDTHWIPIFNPGSNTNQVSRLRLINANDEPVEVTITGVDDVGQAASGKVLISIPSNSIRSITATELESGIEGLEGKLGVGTGNWQLFVDSDQLITVVNLLENPTGHLTNLSTVPQDQHREDGQDTSVVADTE